MKTSLFTATIGGKSLQVGVVELDQLTPGEAPEGRTHHLWLLDRSGSMHYDLNMVMDQVTTASSRIKANDLLSIGWFSGAGQFKFHIIGARASDDITKLVDQLRNSVGLTCFSEVLAEAKDVAERFGSLVDQTEITLFTDGNPVGTPWGSAADEARSIATAKEIADATNLVAFNAIGYTRFYNIDFLQALVATSAHGRFVHAGEIDDFLITITENIERAADLVSRRIDIEAPSRILYVGDSATLRDDDLTLTSVSPNQNLFFFLFDETAGSDRAVTFSDNGEVHNLVFDKSQPKTDTATKNEFLYAYGARMYSQGFRQIATDIYGVNLRDKALAEAVMEAFAPLEVAEATNKLESAITDTTARLTAGLAPIGFVPKRDAFCVMDLFTLMFAYPGEAFYVPYSKNTPAYERVSRKTTAQQNLFTPSKDEVREPVEEFIWNKERLNLSIRFFQSGIATLNANSAKRVELPTAWPCGIFRTHTLVKDGSANVKQAEFLLSEELAEALGAKLAGTKHGALIGQTEVIDGKTFVRTVINLAKLPVINRLYVDDADDLNTLHASVVEMTRLEAAQKVAKNYLEMVMEAKVAMSKQGDYKQLTAEQIAVLADHGVTDKGVYSGIGVSAAKVEDADAYETRKFSFAVKGTVNLPSIKDFEAMKDFDPADPKKKDTKRPNWGGELMIAYDTELRARIKAAGLDLVNPNVALRDFLQDEVKSISKQLAGLRQTINLIKMAKALTNDFFHGVSANEKGEFILQPSADAPAVVIKTERVTDYV